MPNDIIEIFPDGRREVRFRPLLPEQVPEAMVELCLGYRHAIYQLQVSPLLALTTYDIYLNEVAYWRNVPEKVYNYYIGGYQVIKKWLSYREKPLLGRPLTPEEAREVMNMARRLAAIVLMEPALNANYQHVKDQAPTPGRAGKDEKVVIGFAMRIILV